MNKLSKTAVLASGIGLLCSNAAHALALGDVDVYSSLNEPLVAVVEVVGNDASELTAELLTSPVFTNSDLVQQFAATEVSVSSNDANRPVIKLTGALAFTEPFLHFRVSVKSATTTSARDYMVLLDPPGTVITRPNPPIFEPKVVRESDYIPPVAGPREPFVSDPQGKEVYLIDVLDEFGQPTALPLDPKLKPEIFPIRNQESITVAVPVYLPVE